jgi:phytoene dehydrogenase-like protein
MNLVKAPFGMTEPRGNYQQVFHPLGMGVRKVRLPISKGIILEDRGVLHKLPKISSLFKAKTLQLKDISLLLHHLGRLALTNHNKYFNVSIQQWLDSIDASPRLVKLFRILSMSLLVCPFLERASLGEFLLNLKHINITGLGHPEGGFHQIHQSLIWKIKSRGGILQMDAEVQEIIIEHNRAVGVRVNDKEIRAKLIISSVPLQKLHTILDASVLEDPYRTFITNLRPTAGISIDYGLSEKVYNEIMFLTAKPDILGSFTSNIDPLVAPQNKQLVTFLNVLNVEDVRSRAKIRDKQKLLEEKILSMFPRLKDKIEWKRTLILEMVDGVELNITQTQDKRPDIQVPGISNLFIASDSTRAEGAGGDIAFSSAKLCFDRILLLKSNAN